MKIIKGYKDEIIKKQLELRERKHNLYKKNMLKSHVLMNYKQFVYYGTKWINTINVDTTLKEEDFQNYLSYMVFIMKTVKRLTFREFMNVFPILKEFDGERFEMKDYYSTMDWLKNFDLDSCIDENVYELYANYYNNDVIAFSVKEFMFIDRLNRFQGKKSMLEAFFEEQDIHIDTYTHDKENNEMINNTTGETIKVKQPLPRITRQFHIIDAKKEPR